MGRGLLVRNLECLPHKVIVRYTTRKCMCEGPVPVKEVDCNSDEEESTLNLESEIGFLSWSLYFFKLQTPLL